MNSLTITGSIGKDCEIRMLADGTPVAAFSVADNQAGKDKPPVWWSCSLFGKRAESLSQYLLKGQQVTVIGSVTERSYTDKDGNQRKSMDVRVNDVALQGGKREPQSHEYQRPEEMAAPPRASQPAPRQAAAAGSGFDDMDDDVPF